MKEKQYKQYFPVRDDVLVKDQFGFLPLSIINPSKASKERWARAYFEQDTTELRRGETNGYLPGLQFSEFHAGLCESLVKYWSLKNSIIVDPFAGRATRAVVSATLGRRYYGYEISPNTHMRSLEHYTTAGPFTHDPTLYLDDGCLLQQTPDNFSDMILTCPPYFDIEQYESVTGQLSDISNYAEFMQRIQLCATNIYRVMKPGSFCVWVCADFSRAGVENHRTSRTFESIISISPRFD